MTLPTRITGAAAALGVLLGGARMARADVALSTDFAIGIPVDQTPVRYLDTGAGFDVRLGYRFIIPYQHIAVIPELAAGYTDLSAYHVRVRPGLRVGIGRLLVPFAYGHVGWAYTNFDPKGVLDADPATPSTSAQGLSFDVGGGLDVVVLPHLTVGTHLGYNVVNVAGTDHSQAFRSKWMSFGLGATLYL
jgi:hypothetical protein